MIADNQVKAKIDAKQQMISFIDANTGNGHGSSDDGSTYLSVVESLEAQNLRIIELMQKVSSMSTSLRTSKQYIQRDLSANLSGLQGVDESSGA